MPLSSDAAITAFGDDPYDRCANLYSFFARITRFGDGLEEKRTDSKRTPAFSSFAGSGESVIIASSMATGWTQSGKIVEKPWGHELIWAHTERYVGKILHINKGESLSYQYHVVKDETVRLLSGVLEMDVERDGERRRIRLQPGDCLHIVPGMKHRMSAIEECDVLEVSTPELDDVVRLEDRYGRADPSPRK